MIRLSITFGVFIILPLIASARNVFVNYTEKFVDSYKAANVMDFYKLTSDICGNETLTLNFSSPLTLNDIGAPNIKCITVKTTKLNILSGAFNNVPNLKYLDLGGNDMNVSSLFTFGQLPNLKVLLLEDQNQYHTNQTSVYDVYPELEYMSLRNTGLSGFRNTLGNSFPKLKYLNLANNRIKVFLSGIFSTLTHLDLSNNSITRFTSASRNLLFLWLDNNNIREIGEHGLDLSKLKYLKVLSITNNLINFIPKGAFRSLADLRYLNLSENSLSSFNLMPELEYLKSLEILALDRTSLQDISKMSASNITILSLKCNNIMQLTVYSFVNVTNLRKLILSNNQISFLHPDVFQNQQLLEELNLDNNQLEYLPDNWFRPLKNLRYLNLSRNKFIFPESVFHLGLPSNLEVLHFEGSNLTYVTKSMLQMMSANWTIYLNIGSESNAESCSHSSWSTTISPRNMILEYCC